MSGDTGEYTDDWLIRLNLNFEFESTNKFLMNLNFVFSKSMNLNLNFIFSKSMNLNFVFSKSMNLKLNFKIRKKMNGSNPTRYTLNATSIKYNEDLIFLIREIASLDLHFAI